MSAISARLVDDFGNVLLTIDRNTTGLMLKQIDLGFPTVREATSNLSGMSGELDVTQYTGGRAITAEVWLPQSGVGPLMDTVRGLMHPGRRMWLQVWRDDWGVYRRIRVRGASLTATNGGLPLTAQLGWKSATPTFEDVSVSSVTLNAEASGTGGMSFPMSFPMAFDPGLVSGAAILNVGGTANARPTIDIYGPVVGPLVRVVDTGAQMSFPDLYIVQGDYLHIDCQARTITLNNDPTQSRYNTLDFATSQWLYLPPGTAEVVFSPTNPSPPCVAVLSWRSQYL